jgi:hypothetical protein
MVAAPVARTAHTIQAIPGDRDGFYGGGVGAEKKGGST